MSVETTNPLEEFKLVQNEMEIFSNRFNSLLLERKTALLLSKQQYINKVNELQRRLQRTKDEIETQSIRKRKMAGIIDSTLQGLHTKQVKVDGLDSQLNTLKGTREELERDVGSMKKEVQQLESALKFATNDMDAQTLKDYEELTKFEMYLGLRIEAVEIDLLKFRFVNIDPNDIDKDVWCELFVGDDDYKIGRTSPILLAEQTSPIMAEFNSQGSIITFLKAMRKALREAR